MPIIDNNTGEEYEQGPVEDFWFLGFGSEHLDEGEVFMLQASGSNWCVEIWARMDGSAQFHSTLFHSFTDEVPVGAFAMAVCGY